MANKPSYDPKRRAFLKALGVSAGGTALLAGCGDTDIINAVSIEVRKEKVLPNVDPQDFVRPGISVYYASTCQQCPAGCGVHARVREGRVLKLEGNPASPVNRGRLCPMGQAGLHAHYNPDRLRKPLMRKAGKLVEVSWQEAERALLSILGKKNGKLAWLTGVVSGHTRALIEAHTEAVGGKHFVFDPVYPAVGAEVNARLLGEALPRYDLAKASLIVSFGADFLGAWLSPVQFAAQYAEFRKPPRGTLIQFEPKMTLTGANADRWIPIRAGSEAALMLAIAKLLARDSRFAAALSDEEKAALETVDPDAVAKAADVPRARLEKVAALLAQRSPSLVLSGALAEGHAHGAEAAKAALLLNRMLGNIGKTILPPKKPNAEGLLPRAGAWRELRALLDGLQKGAIDTVVVYGANPLYHAPKAMKADAAWKLAKRRVVFATMLDETAAEADLVLPVHSYLEEWTSAMPLAPAEEAVLSLQQPVMTPVFGDGTRAFGDLVLAALKKLDGAFARWPDAKSYLREALWALRNEIVDAPKSELPGQSEEEGFRQGVLAAGLVRLKADEGRLSPRPSVVKAELPKADRSYPFALIPSPRLGLWDGRHAHLPWMQEFPDQLTGVVWDSWVEIHPETAKALGIQTGDLVRVSSAHGSVETKAFVTPAIHKEAVAIPLGQGHWQYGRFAKGRGVHPYRILAPEFDAETGELATYATRVKVEKVASGGGTRTLAVGRLVLESWMPHQSGRTLVRTLPAKDFERTEPKDEEA